MAVMEVKIDTVRAGVGDLKEAIDMGTPLRRIALIDPDFAQPIDAVALTEIETRDVAIDHNGDARTLRFERLPQARRQAGNQLAQPPAEKFSNPVTQ
jgi:hypothetical protein